MVSQARMSKESKANEVQRASEVHLATLATLVSQAMMVHRVYLVRISIQKRAILDHQVDRVEKAVLVSGDPRVHQVTQVRSSCQMTSQALGPAIMVQKVSPVFQVHQASLVEMVSRVLLVQLVFQADNATSKRRRACEVPAVELAKKVSGVKSVSKVLQVRLASQVYQARTDDEVTEADVVLEDHVAHKAKRVCQAQML